MLTIHCALCRKELEEPGALLFSPPTMDISVDKVHWCVECYKRQKDLLAATTWLAEETAYRLRCETSKGVLRELENDARRLNNLMVEEIRKMQKLCDELVEAAGVDLVPR